MLILGIESTCDETGVAVVKDGKRVLSNFLASSVDIQNKFGGVVPEVAAREQVKFIVPLIQKALRQFDINNIDAVAVAYGPGLVGSLLIGVETAKALSLIFNIPLIPVNHLVGHIYSNWLEREDKLPEFPLVGLVVSGGHTDLVYMKNEIEIEHLGGTLDDAAGEAFDKVAKHLNLPYPGGPQIQKRAALYTGYDTLNFPRPLLNSKNFNLSFSGLKTSVVNYIDSCTTVPVDVDKISFSFEQAVVDVLAKKTMRAASEKKVRSIVVGGGVAANKRLREQLEILGSENMIEVFFPRNDFSVDNGAMIASAAFFINNSINPLRLSADPALHFD